MPSAMRRLQLVAEPLVFAPEPLIFSAESLLLALERFDVVLGVFGSFPQGIDGVGWGARRSGRLRIRTAALAASCTRSRSICTAWGHASPFERLFTSGQLRNRPR
jgi:hypothetical protein